MASSDDLRQLINILDEEGFGALAGELLAEISLGREVEKPATSLASEVDGGAVVTRVPIAEGDQFAEAMRILRMRLVEPVRAFAEAEEIASGLAEKAEGVRIRFVDPETRDEAEPLSRREIGVATLADELDDLLKRLPQMVEPPTAQS